MLSYALDTDSAFRDLYVLLASLLVLYQKEEAEQEKKKKEEKTFYRKYWNTSRTFVYIRNKSNNIIVLSPLSFFF